MSKYRGWLWPISFLIGGFTGVYVDRYIQPNKVSIAKSSTIRKEKFTDVVSSPASLIMKFGYPSYENLKTREDYVLSYNRVHRTANWVFEHLTREKLMQRIAEREDADFVEDPSVIKFFRSSNKDYAKSGFDRGHLAAAGNHKHSEKAMKDTFYLSNISPQIGEGFNRGIWNRLEQHARGLTKIYRDVYVCSGPLYLPRLKSDGKKYVKYQVIGKNNVAVPTHFFKVIAGEGRRKSDQDSPLEIQAFIMPNAFVADDTPLHSFMVPLESIEKSSGLIFFDKIPRASLNSRSLTY